MADHPLNSKASPELKKFPVDEKFQKMFKPNYEMKKPIPHTDPEYKMYSKKQEKRHYHNMQRSVLGDYF